MDPWDGGWVMVGSGPQRIGPYRIEGRLGVGGMGEVFLAASAGGRKLAIKVIRPEYAADPRFRQRFAREVAAARRVVGLHTAQVVDADTDAAAPWLATAYIPGPTLRQLVTTGQTFNGARLRGLAAGLAEGLGEIHACGVVHRDLTPGNVVLAADGPRIIDFGIAQGPDAGHSTGNGETTGTYAFMSPEQVRGEGAGPASDMFSLGCVLTYAATGHGPFDAPAVPAIVYRILHERPNLTGIPGEARGLVAACLAKDPAQRPGVAQILAGLNGEGPEWPAPPDADLDETRPDAARFEPTPSAWNPAPSFPVKRSIPRRAIVVGGLTAVVAATATAIAVPLATAGGRPGTVGGRAATRSSPAGLRPSALVQPRTSLTGHTQPVHSIAFSRDGTHLASGGYDNTVRVWNLATDKLDLIFRGHTGTVWSVAWSPDGGMVASASLDNTIRLWDLRSGECAAVIKTGQFNVNALAFSPNGRTLVGVNPGVRLWDITTLRAVASMSLGDSGVNGTAFSPDGRTVIAGVDASYQQPPGKTVQVLNGTTLRRLGELVGHTDSVECVAYSPDGTSVASGATDQTVRLWDVATRTARRVIQAGAIVDAVAYSPSGATVAAGCADKTARLWSTATGALTATLTGHTEPVNTVAFSPDGRTLAGAGGSESDDTINLWTVA